MKVEKGALKEEKTEGRCILVALQLDSNGRDLLNWVLSKIAEQGDRIVAVHVCRNSDLCKTTTLSLIKVLDDYLAVYEGLCSLKQVLLVGRVSRGNSIRKVIVKEAELCSAMAVVVGVNKNHSLGGSASLARYCARKLHPTTALFAVDNGKIIFEKGATEVPPGLEADRKKLYSILHPSIGMEPKVIIPSSKPRPDFQVPKISDARVKDVAEKKEVLIDQCICGSDQTTGSSASSVTTLVRRLPEPKPGWPLLRKAISANIDASRDPEARKMSVVQWVMSLPSRSLPSNQPQVDKNSPSASMNLSKESEIIFRTNSSSCKWFQIEELQSITSQFSSENLIGKGGNGRVYKGCLSDGQEAAIKLSRLSAESSKNFLLEADIITSLQHECIIPLIGVCMEDGNLITVYKFFPNGNLEENLHGKKANTPLPWDMRFKVAVGVAEALSYLHNDGPRSVIHRDVKSSNILLSNELEPRLSDFGLAIWAPMTSSYLTHSDVVGTFGYLAPEYFMYGKVSDKIDVYAFGVLLLELLTGRKPINNENPKGQESLVMWATPILERGNIIDFLDPNLDAKYDEDQMRRTVLAASLCIKRAAYLRPPMKQILRLLQGEDEVEAWMDSHINNTPKELDCHDDETYPALSFGSHLGLALLDVDDDASVTSFEQNHFSSWEEYLKGRWSRSSSFD